MPNYIRIINRALWPKTEVIKQGFDVDNLEAKTVTKEFKNNDNTLSLWAVDNEDDAYILGDIMLGADSNIDYVKRLNGKIHIVLGNHDTTNRERKYRELPNVVEVAEVGIRFRYGKYHFVLTHYPMLTGNLERESLKQMTCNIYGHTHQKSKFYEDRPYMYCVCADANGGYPEEIEEIILEMNRKVKECLEFLDI